MQYSLEVGTKWYKAPEIIYGSRDYTEKVDMWSLGTILAELLDHTPIFTGTTDLDKKKVIDIFSYSNHSVVRNELHTPAHLHLDIRIQL